MLPCHGRDWGSIPHVSVMSYEREMLSKETLRKEKEEKEKLKDYLQGALFCLRDEIIEGDWKIERTSSFKKGIEDVQSGFLLKRVLKKHWF